MQAYKNIPGIRTHLIGIIFLKEYSRIRLSEAVYTLLYITNHEYIVTARNRCQNKLLNHIAVLILINIYLLIQRLEFLCRMCDSLIRTQHLESKMLNVRKAQYVILTLYLGIPPGKPQNKLNKSRCRSTHALYHIHILLGTPRKKLTPYLVDAAL